jgi:ABC-type dipeptide/oligopeptide/nickel transport system ATPase component
MTTANAIKALIKARNERYSSELLRIKVSEDVSWTGRKVLTITGHEVASMFSSMSSFLNPMVAIHIEVIDNHSVKIELN